MRNLSAAVVSVVVIALLVGCATIAPTGMALTGSGFETQITESYNERTDTDTTAYLVGLEENPLTVVQFFLNKPRSDEPNELGMFMQVINRSSTVIPEYEQLVFEVDGERFTFYGAPAFRAQIALEDQSAESRGYYYASPPDVGNLVQMQQLGGASFEDQLSEVTDTDPEATEELLQQVIEAAPTADQVVVKLFAEDEVDVSTTYVLSQTDQEVLAEFHEIIQSEL